MLLNIVMLMLSATLANHMGLVDAVEKLIRHKIPILNCSKCATFWTVLTYQMLMVREPIASVALSFISAYVAVWFEMALGWLETKKNKIYESIYPEETNPD